MLLFESDLMGKVLIASPNLNTNSYFSQTVIYVLRNSVKGSVGLIINQPLPELKGSVVVKHKKENIPIKLTQAYAGGPVEMEKGFILHLDKQVTLGANPLIKLSSDISVLKSVSKGTASSRNSLFIFGYCVWSNGQLEEEILDNHWLIAPPDKKIIFGVNDQKKWHKYLNLLSVNLTQYVDYPGSC